MSAKRMAVLAVVLFVLLFSGAIVQALRVVRPSEVLPGLTAIESLTSQVSASRPGVGEVRKARTELESLVARLNSQRPSRDGARTLQELGVVSAALAAADGDLVEESLHTTTIAAEISGRVKLIKDQVGSPPAFDRLAGLTIKELLIGFAWPLVVIVAVLYFLGSAAGGAHLKAFIRQFDWFKLAGMEWRIGGDLKQKAEDAFNYHREQVKKSFDLWAQRKMIRETVNRILEQDVEPFLREELKKAPEYRCTIHVPDILFADSLYQLIDYAPKGEGPRGRAWSVRYGMVGKQWRLGQNDASGEIPTDPEDLIRDWGMTRAEAREAGRRQSLVCKR